MREKRTKKRIGHFVPLKGYIGKLTPLSNKKECQSKKKYGKGKD